MRFSMHLKDSPFDSIKAGTKDIEMRLYDEKRKLINVTENRIYIASRSFIWNALFRLFSTK